MASDTKTAQLVVIGGGPGGYAAAFMGADLGLDTVLIDPEENPGGVCLYRGCIPSKALLHAAKLINEANEAHEWGISFPRPRINVGKLRNWKSDVVQRLTGGLGQLGKQRKVKHIRGTARFRDARTLEVKTLDGESSTLAFQHAVLAAGSRPVVIPNLQPDSPLVMDSTAALDLADIPQTLLVVGGGYIGLELGTVYAALGSKVTVVEMTPGLLPGADRDLVAILAKRLDGIFDSILLNTRVSGMKVQKNGMRVSFESKDESVKSRVFEKVLIAVGRRPNSENLGLENTAVQIDQRGFVKVDEQLRTGEPSIFAIGDVAGEPMLAHKATHEGRLAVEVIAGRKAAFETRAIPAIVFTDPELAWCGLTETQARAGNHPHEVARFPWAASGRALTLGRTDGITKLIFDPETHRLLGMGLVGSGAGELIAEGVLAIEMGAVAEDIGLSIHPHPTLSETVMEAADLFLGQSTHFYRRKK